MNNNNNYYYYYYYYYHYYYFGTNVMVNFKPGQHMTGAPYDNFRENICSEDDLRSRIFGTFVAKFLA